MSVYESLRRVLEYAIDYLDILPNTAEGNEDVAAVRQMLDAYFALAPDWANAPDWAQWYAIDTGNVEDCDAYWHENEPHLSSVGWFSNGNNCMAGTVNDLPLGIDWRRCKWSRPEATQ